MALDKAIEHGKEHRKPYKGAKAIDNTCRNHGSCEWCNGNRQYATRKKKEAAESRLKEYLRGNAMERKITEEITKELENASKPLLDFIYKYGNPHTKIIVEMDGVEMVSAECACKFEIRD